MIEVYLNNSLPIIISMPHSGRIYSQNFLKNTLLSKKELQYSEDNYVDKVLSKVLSNNISYVKANFPRSFIDVNRNPLEIDPLMISSEIPKFEASKFSKVESGIGVIHRVSCYGNEIYGRSLSRKEIINRLLSYYFPYHRSIKSIIKKLKQKHDIILLLDFHSMPSKILERNIDIVVGNNFNSSCNKTLSSKAIKYFNYFNYSSSLNDPFAGGYITQYYGKPIEGVNVLQIEINRSLYMNEETLELENAKVNSLSINIDLIIKSLITEINNIN